MIYKGANCDCDGDCVFTCGILVFAIGCLAFVISLCALSDVQITREIDYQNKLYEKEVLEYRLEKSDENTVGNEMLYNDIVEFNNSLRETKKWANNPFTNWFWNKDIATIEYIEFRE